MRVPEAQNSENAIVSAVLVDSRCAEAVFQTCSPADFLGEFNREVIEAVQALVSAGEVVDVAAILARLPSGSGAAGKLGRLMDFPAAGDLEYHCGLIRQAARRREIAQLCSQALQACNTENWAAFDAVQCKLRGDEFSGSALMPPRIERMRITGDELAKASLSPACIVRDYLFADVATLAAPGGTGKSTLTLYEMIHIVLGRPLYGLDVLRPGWCLFITAEDSREILLGRLREIMAGLGLSVEERQRAMAGVCIWDVSGLKSPKLIQQRDGNIELTSLADNIVTAYKQAPPVLITFDPTVSFGTSETLVNDNEQGLVAAARRIIRTLGCCVRFIAHTGKSNAREKSLDQYTSRGGSALPDGARMVAVLQSWAPGDGRTPPPGCNYAPDTSISILARPKLSYAPANQPLLWIKRSGWAFEHFVEIQTTDRERDAALFEQIERFIASEVAAGRKHSRNTLETELPKNITRADARRAINHLMASGRIAEIDLPKSECRGGKKTYIRILARTGEVEKNTPKSNSSSLPPTTSPPYREDLGGEVPPQDPPPSLALSGEARRGSARLARLAEKTPNSHPPDIEPEPNKDSPFDDDEARI